MPAMQSFRYRLSDYLEGRSSHHNEQSFKNNFATHKRKTLDMESVASSSSTESTCSCSTFSSFSSSSGSSSSSSAAVGDRQQHPEKEEETKMETKKKCSRKKKKRGNRIVDGDEQQQSNKDKKTKPRKEVRFARKVVKYNASHELPEEGSKEESRLWYTAEDVHRVRMDCVTTVQLMLWVTAGSSTTEQDVLSGACVHDGAKDNNSVCFRGLENHTKVASQRRNEIKRCSRRAVLDGQLFLSLQQHSENSLNVHRANSKKKSRKNKKSRRFQDDIVIAAADAAQQQLAKRYRATVQTSVQAAHIRGLQDEVEAKRLRIQDFHGITGDHQAELPSHFF